MTRLRSARGFTLMEVLIVMSLIVLLSSIGMIGYQTSVKRGREAVLLEDLYRMRDAIDQFYVDKGKYPVDLSRAGERWAICAPCPSTR